MLESLIRPQYQQLLVDKVAHLIKNKISANQVTYASGLFGLLILPLLYFHHPYFAITTLLASGYLDTLDGTLARLTNSSSNWGTLIDIFIDRLVECVIVLALFLQSPEVRGAYCLMMLGSMLLCVTTFLVAGIFIANESNKSFHYSAGLMERAEAFAFFVAMILLPQAFKPLAIVFVLLVTFTAIFRIYECSKQLR